MARPIKTTVDYFPHVTQTGKTIAVLEARWGNDGYAFWFKTLELLGSSEGFYYDRNKPADWEYLLSKTRVTEDQATAILGKLAEIDAIDAGLWAAGIIWSDHFAANLGPVFDKRKTAPPQRPRFPAGQGAAGVSVTEKGENAASGEFPGEETDKVKESKGEQRKAKQTKDVVGGAGEGKPACPSRCRDGVVRQADTVYLKPAELEKLAREVGAAGAARIVELLDAYKTNNPDKCARYRDDYKVIRSWVMPRYQQECDNRTQTGRAGPPGAAEAWEEVTRLIRSTGPYRAPAYSCDTVRRAVQSIGWRQLCDSDNPAADRAHFLKIYESLRQNQLTMRENEAALAIAGASGSGRRLTN